jgi:hypothetical protein
MRPAVTACPTDGVSDISVRSAMTVRRIAFVGSHRECWERRVLTCQEDVTLERSRQLLEQQEARLQELQHHPR